MTDGNTSDLRAQAAHLKTLIERQRRALKAERAKAASNHWGYDHNSHQRLLNEFRENELQLKNLEELLCLLAANNERAA